MLDLGDVGVKSARGSLGLGNCRDPTTRSRDSWIRRAPASLPTGVSQWLIPHSEKCSNYFYRSAGLDLAESARSPIDQNAHLGREVATVLRINQLYGESLAVQSGALHELGPESKEAVQCSFANLHVFQKYEPGENIKNFRNHSSQGRHRVRGEPSALWRESQSMNRAVDLKYS